MKKFFPGLLAIVIAISLSAFSVKKQHHSSKFTERVWFEFTGEDPTDLGNASMYVLDGSSPTVCSSLTKAYRCEIHAFAQSGNSSLPNLSTIDAQTKRDNP